MTVVLIILSVTLMILLALVFKKNNKIETLENEIEMLQNTTIGIGAKLTDAKSSLELLDEQLREANELNDSINKQLSEAYESLNKKRDYEKQLLEKHSEDLITVKDLTAENEILKERQTKYEKQISVLTEENKNLKSEFGKKTIEPEKGVLKSDNIPEKKVLKKKVNR